MNALPKAKMYRVAMLLKARAELVEEIGDEVHTYQPLNKGTVGVVYRLHPETEVRLSIEVESSNEHMLTGFNLDGDLIEVGIRAIIAAIDTELATLGIEITDAVEKELES